VISSWLLLTLAVASADSNQTKFSSLPVSAQASISAAVGRDFPPYRVHSAAQGLRADNIRQELTATFSTKGVELCAQQAHLHMSARGFGYEKSLQTLGPVAPRADGNRVEYRRGGITEWYVNGPMGLEQGFTVQQAPGVGSGPLTVLLGLSGDINPALEPGRTALSLVGKADLKYSGLTATDAVGMELRAWLELKPEGVLIKVDDSRAIYPVTIDPWIQSAKLTSSGGQAFDLFGSSVAIDGNTIVVGISRTDRNVAYVFVKPASGWSNMKPTATLHPADQQIFAGFGLSVAISGDTVAVAAPIAQFRNRRAEGAVYVFVKPPGGWKNMKQTTKLNVFQARLELPVVISGNTIAVSGTNSETSVVYLFVKPQTGWKVTSRPAATLLPDRFAQSFGQSLAAAGDTVAVGAPNSFSGEGAVYLFLKPTAGWSGKVNPTARLVGSDGLTDVIGFSVATDGTTVAAGAFGANQSRGAVYVYSKPSGGWADATETAVLSAADTVDLGFSTSISGNSIVGSSPFATVGSNPQQGAAFIFVKPPDGWKTTSTPDATLFADDGAPGDQFAFSVAISGNTVVSGSPNATVGSKLNQGAAYVFGQ
jgi:hypothetical protein